MARGEMMLGPGGVMKVARSESAALDQILTLLNDGEVTAAISKIKALRNQVSQGYHNNPYTPFRVIGTIGKDVHEIRYTHQKDGVNYKHEFGGDVEVLAIERHGKKELLLKHKRGLPLWDEF